MKVIISNLLDDIEDVHISKYANYYFFENYVISEVHEGETYNWEAAQELISLIYSHYGENPSINLVSNRINNYALVPTDWIRFFNSKHSSFINSISIVTYNTSNLLNIMIEKLFIKMKVNHFNELDHAINWLNQGRSISA